MQYILFVRNIGVQNTSWVQQNATTKFKIAGDMKMVVGPRSNSNPKIATPIIWEQHMWIIHIIRTQGFTQITLIIQTITYIISIHVFHLLWVRLLSWIFNDAPLVIKRKGKKMARKHKEDLRVSHIIHVKHYSQLHKYDIYGKND